MEKKEGWKEESGERGTLEGQQRGDEGKLGEEKKVNREKGRADEKKGG